MNKDFQKIQLQLELYADSIATQPSSRQQQYTMKQIETDVHAFLTMALTKTLITLFKIDWELPHLGIMKIVLISSNDRCSFMLQFNHLKSTNVTKAASSTDAYDKAMKGV